MQHLNYCRQAIPQLAWKAKNHKQSKERADCATALYRLQVAQKFLLPKGGRVLVDSELRALDGMRLELPYETIALEFSDGEAGRITLAWQLPDAIAMMHLVPLRSSGEWVPTCMLGMPRTDYVGLNGLPKVSVADPACPDALSVEAGIEVLCLLNALACSNVHIDRSEAKKTHKAMRKKGALPFDDYHILTVDAPGRAAGAGDGGGSHRSPREHLRRGHIRRLQDGRKLWVNATVVNPGVGGKVDKDYRLAA